MRNRDRHTNLVRSLAAAYLGFCLCVGGAHAQSNTTSTDLSQLVVSSDALGDGWTISGQGPEESANSEIYSSLLPNAQPRPIADYVVEFKQDTHTVHVGLYEYSDRSTALGSPGFADPPLFWGHGFTSFQPLTG